MAGSKDHVHDSIDHLFRHHAGRMVSVLCRIFGFDRIDMIEDAVQDALVAALRKWPFAGPPENPTAWLTQTAKNRLIDRLRHESRSQTVVDIDVVDPVAGTPPFFNTEIEEDQLRMIYACCHPSIPPDSQVALTLKIVGGFSVAEIANAYLSNHEAVAKMLTRAKSSLQNGKAPLDIPAGDEIPPRINAVLKVLYLMFNEGYGASDGNELIRHDLCFEAIRLVEFLARHPLTASPRVNAAAALFLFQAARLPARTDDAAELVLLADQNRSLWDRRLIARGLAHFRLSARGDELTTFHLEAEIAGIYTLSEDFGSTDWTRILECYDLLQSASFSPVVELNRIIVLDRIKGPEEALSALTELSPSPGLENYSLLHVTRGHVLARLGQISEANASFSRGRSLSRNDAIRRFISNRIEDLNISNSIG